VHNLIDLNFDHFFKFNNNKIKEKGFGPENQAVPEVPDNRPKTITPRGIMLRPKGLPERPSEFEKKRWGRTISWWQFL